MDSRKKSRVAAPLVTVILPVKAFSASLTTIVRSLLKQTYTHWELLILIKDVIGGDSLMIDPRIKVMAFTGGKNAARNHGAQLAKGKYLLHIDDDLELTPQVLRDCVRQSARFAAVAIPEQVRGATGFWRRVFAREKQIAVSKDKEIISPRFIEKALYRKLGGINESLDPIDEGDLKEKLQEQSIDRGETRAYFNLLLNPNDHKLSARLRKKFLRGRKARLFTVLYPASHQLHAWRRAPQYLRGAAWYVVPLVFLKTLDYLAFTLGRLTTSKADRRLIAQQRNDEIFQEEAGNYQVESFERTLGAQYVNRREQALVKPMLKGLVGPRPSRLLDIGAGGGRWTKLLLDMYPNASITSFDRSEHMVAELKITFKEYGPRFQAVQGDMQSLPFPDVYFDGILSVRAIKYPPNQRKVFSEIGRVLKPGGAALIELSRADLGYKLSRHLPARYKVFEYGRRVHLLTPRKISVYAAHAGMSIELRRLAFAVPSTPLTRVNSRPTLAVFRSLDRLLPKVLFGRSRFIGLKRLFLTGDID